MRYVKILVAAAVLGPFALALAQTTSMTFTYRTAPPATGSPVAVYEWQVSGNGGSSWVDAGTSPDPSKAITLAVGGTYVVRVRGTDAQDRSGPWSVASDPNSPDPGPPGACGKPTRQ